MEGIVSTMMNEWFSFAVIMAIGQFSPGPDMILLTRVSLANGRAAGWATAIGIACGLMFHAGLAIAGLAVLLEKFTVLEVTLSIVAACYLIWLAWCLLQSVRKNESVVLEEGQKREISLAQHWRRGFLCNVLNPKVAIFLAGVTLPFAKLDSSLWWQSTLGQSTLHELKGNMHRGSTKTTTNASILMMNEKVKGEFPPHSYGEYPRNWKR